MANYDELMRPASAPTALDSTSTGGFYDDLMRSETERQRQLLKATTNTAVDTNPDQYANQRRIANQLGQPTAVVEALPQQSEREAKVQTIERDTQRSPVLARKYTDEDFARLAHDDSSTLASIEKYVSTVGSFASAKARAGWMNLMGSAVVLVDSVQPFTSSAADAAVVFKDKPEEFQKWLNSPAGFMTRASRHLFAKAAEASTDYNVEAKSKYGDLQYFTTDTNKAAYLSPMKMAGDAIESLPTTLALMATALLTRNAGAAAEAQALQAGLSAEVAAAARTQAAIRMAEISGATGEGAAGYAQTKGSLEVETLKSDMSKSPRYKQLIESGYTDQTAREVVAGEVSEQAAQIAGIVDAVTNKVAGKFLGKIFSEGGSLFKRTGAGFATEALTEMPQSMGEQFGENWAKQVTLDPNQRLSEGVMEAGLAGFFVGGLTGAGFSAILGRSNQHEESIKQAEQLKTALEQMSVAAEESKTRARDSVVFNQFVNETVDGTPAETLYISAEALYQSGRVVELSQTLPSVSAQLGNAQVDNGFVAIPTSEFVTNLAGTDLRQAVIDHVKIDPNGYTFAESQQYQQTFDAEMSQQLGKMIEAKAGDDTFKTSRDTVRDQVLSELNAVGRFAPDVNKNYAELLASYYAAMAAKTGMMPEQFAQLYAQRTQGESIKGGRQLDQGLESSVTLGGREISVTLNKTDARLGDRLVNVNVAPFEANFKGSTGFYVGEGGTGASIGNRYQQFGEFQKTAPSIEAPQVAVDAKGNVMFGNGRHRYAFMRDSGLTQIPMAMSKESLANAVKFGYVSAESAATLNQSATLRSGDETLEKYGLDPEGSYKTREVAAALEARQREKYGLINPDDRSDQAIDRIADWMAEEVRFEMRNPEKSGVGWYSEKFQRALDTMGDTFPELKTDKDSRNLMTALIAITSDGQKVLPNFAMAMDIYGRFREGGATPGMFTTSKGHARQTSINKNLRNIQRLYDMMGPTAMHEYLMQEKTIKELKEIAKANGGELKSDYQVHISLPMAAVEFGPKLGAFYANLMGAHGYLTMDRWWSRTFNRYRGTLLQAPTAQSLRNFAALIGKKKLSDDEVLSAVVEPRNALNQRGFKTMAAILMGESEPGGKAEKAKWMARLDKLRETGKLKQALNELKAEKQGVIDAAAKLQESTRASPKTKAKARADAKLAQVVIEHINALPKNFTVDKLLHQHNIERAANTIYKTAFENLEDAPFGATDRTFMLDAVNKAQQKIAAEGYNLSVADIQAILWYYEKRLYGELGARQTADISYEEAAKQVVDAYADGLESGRFDDLLDDAGTASEDGGDNEGEVSAGDELYQSSAAAAGVDETRTPEFTAWFDDSAVSDAAGQPVKVYTGTSKDVDFKSFKIPKNGAWFSTDPQSASQYAVENDSMDMKYEGGTFVNVNTASRVIPAYLSIQNPYKMTDADFARINVDNYKRAQGQFFDELRAKGHDGVDMGDGVWVVIGKPNQIKSAFNERPTSSPDMLKQPARGSIKFGDDITRVPSIISLLQNADFSTFIHESGHFFLQVNADLASRIESSINAGEQVSEGEQSIVDDMNTTLKWFGIAGTPEMTAIQQWMSMSLEEQREYHEKWARGFEAYAFEGKAPSLELQGIFRTFSRWLESIYKRLTALDVKLTDEVRGVMDRMLASNEAIQQAEQVREMGALFTAENSQGLIEDWKAYHDLALATTQDGIDHLQGKALGEMKWLSNARSKRLKEMQAENKDRRTVVGMEARRQVMSQQVYRTWQFLTSKITEDDKVTEDKPRKSDPDSVDPSLDSLFVAIAKLGGLKRDEVKSQWGMEEKIAFPVFGKPVVRAESGLALDSMGQLLAQYGYLTLDENGQYDLTELEEKFHEELRGATQYSNSVDPSIFQEQIPGGNVNTDALNAGRIDLITLNMMGVDPAVVQRLKDLKMAVMNGGLHPMLVAEKFGYDSAEQMVSELYAAPNPSEVIQKLTDAMMVERYGDLATQAGIEQAVNESLYNDMRLRLLHAEGKALDKAMNVRGDAGTNTAGRKKTFAVLPAAARQFADNVVSRLQIKNLRPTQYTAAAEKAGKSAEASFNKGDLEAAARFKRNQILNSHSAQAALKAKDEVDKGKRFFAKVLTGKDKTLAKERDMDIVNAARAVLSLFGYEGKAKSALDYLETVKQYDPTLHAVLESSVKGAMSIAKPLDQLTVEEFRALRDEIESLWHLSKRNRQLEIDGNLIDRQDAAQALNDRMNELGVPDAMPGETSAITPQEESAIKLQQAKAVGRRVESWVDLKDGSTKMGAFRRYIWNPVKDAADAYRDEKITYLKQFRQLLDGIMPTMKREVIAAPELNYTFGKDSGGVAMNEILHALLHTGNDSNKRKLLLGRGWADLNQDGTLDTSRWDAFIARMIAEGKITQAHYDFAQGVWDMLESMKPGAQKAHRDAYGRYFAEVTANAFVTPFGTYSGGYVPAKVDSRIVKDGELRDMIEAGKEGMAYAFPTTPSGFTKSRTEYNKPLMLDMRTLAQHIDQVLLFTHLENPVRNVKLLISDKSVSEPLNRLDPAAINTMLTPWLSRSARQQVTVPVAGIGWVNRVASTLRQRTSMATMLGNVMNALQQVTGFSLAALKVKPGSLLSATGQYMRGPKQMAEAIAAASPYMATRMENEAHAMMGQIEEILINPNLYRRAQDWTKKHQYFLQSAVDNVMGPIIWTGAYNDAIEEGYNHKDAVRLADASVRQTQGSNLPEDVSRIETGPAYNTLMMQFASYFNMQANLLGTELGKVSQEMGLRKGMGKGLMILMLGFYAPAVVAELISQAFRGGPPDDDKDGEYLDDWLMALFVTGPIRNATAMIPIVGQLGNLVVARFNHNPADDKMSLVPAVSQIEAAASVPADLYKHAVDRGRADKTIKDVASLISITTGLPASVAAKPISYLTSVQEGRVNPTGPVDTVRGLITGTASPQSK